jgi:ATP-dependent Clp protease ATP-binding subunit ClpA
VHFSDLDIPSERMGDAARQIVERAIETSQRSEHPTLTSSHLLMALAHVDWPLFNEVPRDVGASPSAVVRDIATSGARSNAALRRSS